MYIYTWLGFTKEMHVMISGRGRNWKQWGQNFIYMKLARYQGGQTNETQPNNIDILKIYT